MRSMLRTVGTGISKDFTATASGRLSELPKDGMVRKTPEGWERIP